MTTLTWPRRQRVRLGRHHLRLSDARLFRSVLGVLWVFDGLLQLQPFMFTRGFADHVIAPAGEGQPALVAGPVDWSVQLIAAHPVFWDTTFATIQLVIGVLILVPRTVRLGLAGSITWGLGIWWFGEGLGGLASGHADMLTGSPGAALLYVVLSAAVWPTETRGDGVGRDADVVASWLPIAWAALWFGSAVLQLLPGQNAGSDLAEELTGAADSGPSWMAAIDRGLGSAAAHAGPPVIALLIGAQVWIGLNGLAAGPLRRTSAAAGIAVAIVCWFTCQACGDLTSGQATDPGTAPLVLLMSLALLGEGTANAT